MPDYQFKDENKKNKKVSLNELNKKYKKTHFSPRRKNHYITKVQISSKAKMASNVTNSM